MNTNNIFEFAKENKTSEIKEKPWVIYVVDDDEGVLKTTKDTLETFTYKDRDVELSFFKNAADVIKMLSKDNPNNPDVAVILLDIVMEDSGFDVIKYLRDRKENNVTQIIMRTGQAGKQIREEHEIAREYEINDFIDKSENNYKRIRTAITTSLRMYFLLKTLSEVRRNLENFNFSLMDFFNLKKDKTFTSSVDYELIIHCIFNHINTNYYNGKKQLSAEALNKLLEAKIQNIQILYVVLFNALQKSKTENILSEDINPNVRESKLIWEKEEKWLENLHKALCGNKIGDLSTSVKFIASDTPWVIFKEHHTGTVPVAPIQWIGALSDLLYLYYTLHKYYYITEGIWDIMHKELELHYCHKSGILNSDTLKTYKAKYKTTKNEIDHDGRTIKTEEWVWDTPNKDLIDEIINNLEE